MLLSSLSARLPQELCDFVIDYSRNELQTVKQCSLVSKSWHARSRVWLYRTIQVVDNLIDDFEYVQKSTGFATMRMRTFTPFLVSDDPVLRHVRCLRVACFWHDDEDSWSEYVSSWLELRVPPHLALERLQVYVHSDQSAGSLLQSLALHFPKVTTLDLHGTFAQPEDMAVCLSSFPTLGQLRFHWGNQMPRAVLEVWLSTPDVQPRPPFESCWLTLDPRVLPLLAHWTSGKHSWIRGIVIENVEATATEHSEDGNSLTCLLRELSQLSEGDRALVRGLHLMANEESSFTRDCRMPIQRALLALPQVRSLAVSINYTRCAQSAADGTDLSDYDPISMMAHYFTHSYEDTAAVPKRAFKCSSLRRLIVDLTVKASDATLLWHHDWHTLDRTFACAEWSDLRELVIGVCVTDCDEAHSPFGLGRFVRRVLPECCENGIIRVRYSEIPRDVPGRRRYSERSEDDLARFGCGAFADAEAWVTHDFWSQTEPKYFGS